MHKKNTQGHSQDIQIVHNEAPAQTILTSILECTLCISRCCNDFPHLHKHQAEKSLKSSPTESHYMHVLMRRHPEIKLSLSSCLAEYSLPDCSDIQGEDLQLLCHSSTIDTLLCLNYSMHLGTLWALSNWLVFALASVWWISTIFKPHRKHLVLAWVCQCKSLWHILAQQSLSGLPFESQQDLSWRQTDNSDQGTPQIYPAF